MRKVHLFSKIAAASVLASVFLTAQAGAATLLSSFDFPGAYETQTGGGSFASSPSPRGASVPLPTGVGAASTIADIPRPDSPTKPKASVVSPGRRNKIAESSGGSSAPRRPKSSVAKKREPEPETATKPSHVSRVDIADTTEAKAYVTTAGSVWTANLGWGWFNKYYFRGVDILKAVSPDHTEGGVATSKLTIAYSREKDAFSVGFGTVQALERQLPKGAALAVKPNNTVRVVGKGKNPVDSFIPKKDNERFNLPPTERYAEYNLYLAYTRELIAGKLQGTINFNRYQFSDGTFYESSGGPIRYADETTVRLDYIGLPIVHPSIAWSHDFDGFVGDYLEFRVDGGFDLLERGSFGVRLEPYVALSYDLKYNGVDNGWNAFEVGLSAPITLNDIFTLTFTGNYTQQLEDSKGQPRTNDGFWGGVVFNAVWGSRGKSPLPGAGDLKGTDKMISIPGEEKRWAISTGLGWRNIDYDFHHNSLRPFDTGRLYNRKSGPGDVGLATAGMDRVYENGAVLAGTSPKNAGTADFRVSSKSQVNGDPATSSNAQVTFTTRDFSYSTQHLSNSKSADDQDSVAFPYLSLDTEVWRAGEWSVRAGLLYSFSYSEGDSGVRLARLDSLFQHKERFSYTYAFDAISTNTKPGDNFNSKTLPAGQNAAVVFDSSAYSKFYKNLGVVTNPADFLSKSGPQTSVRKVDTEVVRVGTFVNTEVNVSAHDLALPITFRHDFGKRLHAEVSAAATLTVVNADIRTQIDFRALDNRTTNVVPDQRGTPPQGTIQANSSAGGFTGIKQSGTEAITKTPDTNPVVVDPNNPRGPQTAVGGGKSGGNVKRPNLPGNSVGHQTFDRSSSDILAGFDGSVSLILDLNEEGTFYAEFWGRYHWVDDLGLSNGRGTSTIDLSGFQAGVGVGVRF